MPDYQDLIALVTGGSERHHLPVVYDFAPCFDAMVGGISDLPRFYFDIEEKMRHQQKLKELFPEALIFPGVFADFGVVAEVSAFGGQLLWAAGQAPYCHPSLNGIKDVDRLKVPVAGTTGLTTPLLVQKELMRDRLKEQGRELEKFTLTMGPAEVAGLLLGYDKFYLSFYDDAKRLKLLMEMVTEFIIEWIRVQGEVTSGNDVVMVADHVCSQVTAPQLEEFILPFIKAIFESCNNSVRVYHNEGFHSDDHIRHIKEFGAQVWHYGSDVHPMDVLLTKTGHDIIPFGGLNPHGSIRVGRPEEVQAEARAVAEAAKGFRALLSTGTGTTPDAPPANVQAMIEGYLRSNE